MDPAATTPNMLAAMLTPFVLISACGSLLISTSNRLGRVVDETRSLRERIDMMIAASGDPASTERSRRKRALLLHQLPYMTRRARLLQTGLMTLYAALAMFVATSVALGIITGLQLRLLWIAMATGFVGIVLLLASSTCLTLEARLALHTTTHEMAWLWDETNRHEPPKQPTSPQR